MGWIAGAAAAAAAASCVNSDKRRKPSNSMKYLLIFIIISIFLSFLIIFSITIPFYSDENIWLIILSVILFLPIIGSLILILTSKEYEDGIKHDIADENNSRNRNTYINSSNTCKSLEIEESNISALGKVFCTECGAMLNFNDNFCYLCGKKNF